MVEAAGIDVVSTANNHARDFGRDALPPRIVSFEGWASLIPAPA